MPGNTRIMRPIYVFLSCAAVALAIATWIAIGEGGVPRLRALQGEKGRLGAETKALTQENHLLEEKAVLLSGGQPGSDATLEKAVREELGFAGKGEVIVIDDAHNRDVP